MAKIKYAGEEAVGRIADYVNAKLTFASSMPSSPDTNTIVLYVGADTSSHKQGGIYQYDGTNWNLINLVKTIELTQAEYDALPSAAKLNGTIYFITDGNVEGSIVSGYYKEADGKFYKDSSYTTEMAANANVLYIDRNTDKAYIYDTTNEEYVQISGSGSGTAIIYVETLPVTGIQDVIYGYDSATDYNEVTADGFLDSDTNFVKVGDVYTAAPNVKIKASADGTTYKDFDSLAYDSVNNEFILTYTDTTSDTLTVGDTFYWQIINRSYLAGNAEEQSLTVLAGAGGGGTAYLPGEGIEINGSVISVAPATTTTLGGVKVDDSTIKVDANGELSGGYTGGFNVKVDGNKIETKTFVGTTEEWNNLTAAQKAKFDTVSITDDSGLPNAIPGHEVLDDAGTTAMPQRSNIHFPDFEVTDDSNNDITVVNEVPYTAGDGIDITNKEVSVDETRPSTFVGTTQEWDALTAAEKAQYKVVNLTNDQVGGEMVVVDGLQDGNLNPVTSNAVYDAINKIDKRFVWKYINDAKTIEISCDAWYSKWMFFVYTSNGNIAPGVTSGATFLHLFDTAAYPAIMGNDSSSGSQLTITSSHQASDLNKLIITAPYSRGYYWQVTAICIDPNTTSIPTLTITATS